MFLSELYGFEEKATMANFLFVMRTATRALDSDSQDFSRLSSKEQSLIHSVGTRANFYCRRDDSRSASICSRENGGEKKGNIYQYMTCEGIFN